MTTVLRTLIPLAVSLTGAAPVLFVREAIERDGPSVALSAAGRGALFSVLVVAGVGAWVRSRDRIRRWFRRFVDEGRAASRPGQAP